MSTTFIQLRALHIMTCWWFGTCFIFPLILGMSSFQLTFIFFRGVAQPPTRWYIMHISAFNPLIFHEKLQRYHTVSDDAGHTRHGLRLVSTERRRLVQFHRWPIGCGQKPSTKCGFGKGTSFDKFCWQLLLVSHVYYQVKKKTTQACLQMHSNPPFDPQERDG